VARCRLRPRELGHERSRRGEVTLSRGRRSDRFKVEEVAPEAAVPVLRRYIDEIRVTRAYFEANPASTDEEIAAELPKHPVFRLGPH
jgi:hypothetical protein